MRKMSSSLWKKGMAAALSAAMMFGVFGGTKTSVSGASGKKADANMDGRANETVTVNIFHIHQSSDVLHIYSQSIIG